MRNALLLIITSALLVLFITSLLGWHLAAIAILCSSLVAWRTDAK